MNLKSTLLVRAFALKSIPLILICRPQVITVSAERTEIILPLGYLTKNHLGSMYFGALAIGADLSVGLFPAEAFGRAWKKDRTKVSFTFKTMKMNFLKRVDGDAHFIVESGEAGQKFIDTVLSSDERHEIPLKGRVTVPKKYGEEILAEFELLLSAKRKAKS